MISILKNPYNTPQAQRMLGQLRFINHQPERLLAEAIATFLHRSASSEEQKWIDRIESLRQEMAASSEKIPVIDYGVHRDSPSGATVERGVAQICRAAATSPLWGPLMFGLIRQFEPNTCLELGTSLGISAAYQGAALELNRSGRLVTLEGAPAVADLAARNFARLGIHRIETIPGRFQDTLDGVLARLGSIDFAFIDGHHDEHATQVYFEKILPYLTTKAVVVFDDVSWTPGMRLAWERIIENSNIATALDMSKVGICILDRSRRNTSKSRISWHPRMWQRAAARIMYAS
jgi:predicted O-methyltransferase YrrM